MSQQVWEVIGFKLPITAKTDSTAGRGIAHCKGCGKVKHLSIRELWLQDLVQDDKVRVVKESALTNLADLGTKALSGARVSELTRMMPLSRRGLTAAILAVCLTPVAGQPKERDIFDPMTFWIYVVLLHVLAAVRLCNLCRDCWFLCWGRRAKPPATHEVEVQPIWMLEAPRKELKPQLSLRNQKPWCTPRMSLWSLEQPPQVTVFGGASSVTVPGRDSSFHGAPSTAGLRQRINRPDLQQQVYVIPRGTKYHNNRCGDLARSRRLHPSGITTVRLHCVWKLWRLKSSRLFLVRSTGTHPKLWRESQEILAMEGC